MSEGFIKLHRKMLDWEWADDSIIFSFFVKLIIMVNYQDKQWHDITIKRGQIVTSIERLCEYTKLSKPAVRRCLSTLIKTGEITEEVRQNKYRIITVTNYDLYQSAVGIPDTNCDTNRSTNRNTNNSTNNSTPTKERKKYSHPYRDENTGAAPGSPGGSGLAPAQCLRFLSALEVLSLEIICHTRR